MQLIHNTMYFVHDLGIAGTLAITQNELEYFANTVDVQLTVESNFEVEFRSQVRAQYIYMYCMRKLIGNII